MPAGTASDSSAAMAPSAGRRQVCKASLELKYRKTAELASTTATNVTNATIRGISIRGSLDLNVNHALHDDGSCHHEKPPNHDHILPHRVGKQGCHILRIHLEKDPSDNQREEE